MKNKYLNKAMLIFMIFLTNLILPYMVFAAEGDCGYELGISTGEAMSKSYAYKEVLFITGKPIVVEGTVVVKKTVKASAESWSYTYSGLTDESGTVILNRTIAYAVAVNQKEDGQIQKQVTIKGIPSERIVVGKTTYTLKEYNFSKSTIVDAVPFSQYFAGEFLGKKTYAVSGDKTGTIIVNTTGKIYGYNQYWSNTESQLVDYTISSKGTYDWTGKASVGISMTSAKKITYEENKPSEISFDGGYVMTQNNVSVLQYKSELPEFTTDGKPTDYIMESEDTLKYDTNPQVNRLVVASLPNMKGHWAESAVKLLYGLEIFRDKPQGFNPNAYMTRADFAKTMVLTGKLLTDAEIAQAEAAISSNNTKAAANNIQIFSDVPTDSPYYIYIKKAYDNKLVDGVSEEQFSPTATITRAEAVTFLIRALGFENRAPSPTVVTTFTDNASIPSWARNSVYVAEKIGLVKGDTYGNFSPNVAMTKAETAILINRFINYMGKDIVEDYRDNILLY